LVPRTKLEENFPASRKGNEIAAKKTNVLYVDAHGILTGFVPGRVKRKSINSFGHLTVGI